MSQHRPAISVVVPLYNKRAYVERALHSVQGQTWQDFEVVVVDDGSTDEGAEVGRALGDNRIRVIRQPNAGVSGARNRGIAESRADLIAFLDADDEWLPDFLQTIVGLTRAFPACDVFATTYLLRSAPGQDRHVILRNLPSSAPAIVLEDYFAIASRSDPPVFSSAVAVSRRALQAIGGFPVGIGQGEDLLTWARLAVRFKIAYATTPHSIFWVPHLPGGMATRRPEIPDPIAGELHTLLRNVDRRQEPHLRRYVGLWHKMRGTMFLRRNEIALARDELVRSMRFSGLDIRLVVYLLLAWCPARVRRWLTSMASYLAYRRRESA